MTRLLLVFVKADRRGRVVPEAWKLCCFGRRDAVGRVVKKGEGLPPQAMMEIADDTLLVYLGASQIAATGPLTSNN